MAAIGDDSFPDVDPEKDLLHKQLMDEPIQLIKRNDDGALEVVESTSTLLEKLETPVVVIAIVGALRTGKSHLMNILAGDLNGFKVSSSIKAETKGIWIWCRPHPKIENTTLILMDTEGLSSIGDNYDTAIMALSLLLSSTLIFNTVGKIDRNFISQLSFVSDITKHIQMKTKQTEDLNFPNLVIAIRDCHQEFRLENKSVTAQEYLEHILSTSPGCEVSPEFNKTKINICKYFPRRLCFALPRPKIQTEPPFLPDSNMNSEFNEKAIEFQRLVFDISQMKKLEHCDKVDGRMFAFMVNCYTKALESGEIPLIRSAFELIIKRENSRILEQCIEALFHACMQANNGLLQ